jgi:hypothetical protein
MHEERLRLGAVVADQAVVRAAVNRYSAAVDAIHDSLEEEHCRRYFRRLALSFIRSPRVVKRILSHTPQRAHLSILGMMVG